MRRMKDEGQKRIQKVWKYEELFVSLQTERRKPKCNSIKISVFKQKGNKETIVRHDVEQVVQSISSGEYIDGVHHLRGNCYLSMKK